MFSINSSTKRYSLTPLVILMLLVTWVHAYFYNGVGWNQIARLDVVYSFVEPGTPDTYSFRINRFIINPEVGVNTGDWARYNGNYYSNKAPGLSVLAIPLYFVLYHVEAYLGLSPTLFPLVQLNAYLLTIGSCLGWTLFGLYFFYRYIEKRTNTTEAIVRSSIYMFCTLMFPFNTQFWGHTTAASFLIASFVVASDYQSRKAIFFSGLLLGLTVGIEYSTAAIVPVLFCWYLTDCERRRKLLYWIAGGIPIALGLMVYHKVAFGSYFSNATVHSNPIFLVESSAGGLFGGFSWHHFNFLLFSWARGLFIYMPVLVFAVWNIIGKLEEKKWKEVLLPLAVISVALILISSFDGWHGGASSGPRYLIFSLPFWCLLLPTIGSLSKIEKLAYLGMAAISLVNMFVISCVNPMVPETSYNPWISFLYQPFLNGRFPSSGYLPHLIVNPTEQEYFYSQFNIGSLLGLSGLWSLVPLIFITGILIIKLIFTLRASNYCK